MDLEYLILPKDFPDPVYDIGPSNENQMIILGGGCFWCVEQIFNEIDGVVDVSSGYSGGNKDTANYTAVCSGNTDHVEVVKIEYDSNHISFGKILKIFFSVAHDPTQIDRQGADIGSQYKSIIFCINEDQFKISSEYIIQLNKVPVYNKPIVTKVLNLENFFKAEEYHQKYAEKNPLQPYILGVSRPKLNKLINQFEDLIKK